LTCPLPDFIRLINLWLFLRLIFFLRSQSFWWPFGKRDLGVKDRLFSRSEATKTEYLNVLHAQAVEWAKFILSD